MIRIEIVRNPSDQSVERFSIKGHANYAEHGQDIVCAGVSTVTVGTVNSIEKLTGIVLQSKMKDGFLNGTVPVIESPEVAAKVQLLLESMIVILESIKESYGQYIQIKQITKKRR